MKDRIKKVVKISKHQYSCIFGENKEIQVWNCKICGYNFFKKASYFNKNEPEKFCKACNVLLSHFKYCERDFLETVQVLIAEYNNLYFVVQVEHRDLKGKKFKLTSDLGVYTSLDIELPAIVIEVNENNHTTYANNQDGIWDNYKKKKEFYESKGIPVIEVDYKYGNPSGNYTPLFTMSNLTVLLDNALRLKMGPDKENDIKKLFPSRHLSEYIIHDKNDMLK